MPVPTTDDPARSGDVIYARRVPATRVRGSRPARTLNRRFHDEVGATPVQWLTRTRVRQARELLETTDLEVGAVGRRVGLGSPSNFRAVFVRHSGVAPRHYRRNVRDTG